jgi:hypothetical protein
MYHVSSEVPSSVSRDHVGCHAKRPTCNDLSAHCRQEDVMPDFPECLLIVTVEVDAAIEAEWNRWYDTVHLPDALKCPGVKRGRRYVSSGEISESLAGKTERTARRIYTTIYELDSPGAVATPEFRAMRGWYHFAPHVRSRTQVIVPA